MAKSVKRLGKATIDRWSWLVIPAIVFLIAFFVYPLFEILKRSFLDPEPGFSNYVGFVQNNSFLRVLIYTFFVAFLITAFCVLLGYPYAYLMTYAGRTVAGLMIMAVLVPFWSSALVRTYAWVVLLQDTGIINSALLNLGVIEEPLSLIRNYVGVTIGMVQVMLPFMVLPIYSVMKNIDLDYVKAASNLGASPFTAFRHIFLPLSLRGVYAGSLLVFVLALGFYITPAILGSPRQAMLSQLVVQQVSDLRNWGMGSTIAFVLLVLTLVVLLVASRFVPISDAFGRGPS